MLEALLGFGGAVPSWRNESGLLDRGGLFLEEWMVRIVGIRVRFKVTGAEIIQVL